MDAIAVVLALEDYQNSIAKNLRVRDITVLLISMCWQWFPPRGEIFFPTRQGERFFFHQAGEGIYLFTRPGERCFHFFKSKAIQADQ